MEEEDEDEEGNSCAAVPDFDFDISSDSDSDSDVDMTIVTEVTQTGSSQEHQAQGELIASLLPAQGFTKDILLANSSNLYIPPGGPRRQPRLQPQLRLRPQSEIAEEATQQGRNTFGGLLQEVTWKAGAESLCTAYTKQIQASWKD